LGSLDIEVYLWTSILATFVFFSATIYSIYRGLPTDPAVLEKLGRLEENLAVNQNMLENTQIGFFRKLEESDKAREEMFRKVTINVDESKKETLANLAESKKETLANLAEHKRALDNMEKENRKALDDMDKENKKYAETIKKQTDELADVKKTIRGLENAINGKPTERAELTSKTRLDRFKSVDPELATKFEVAGINNVCELLAADSTSIAEKVSESADTVADLQSVAQLLMVPGIDEKHAKLLVRFGVTSRRELANQDPVHLYRGVVGIAKTSVEEGKLPPNKIPTIEDVSMWIKQAQL